MKTDLPQGGPVKRPTICVFCGSSHGNDPAYAEAARRFGELMAKAGFDLVFGGGGIGLMGEVATSVSKSGGHVLGIIPAFLRHLEPPLKISTELVVTNDMSERKVRMFEASDAFAVLPGGLGTLDEFSEAITAAQLHLMEKPIVLVNVKSFFAPLLLLIDQYIAEGFARAEVRQMIEVAETVDDAMEIFIAHRNAAAVA